jgi:hypothetical protein
MRFEVLKGVKMSMVVFCVVTLCGLLGKYQRFGGTYCSIFRAKEAVCSSETLIVLSTRLHGGATQRTNIEALKLLCSSSLSELVDLLGVN